VLAAGALARLPLALQRRLIQQASEKLDVTPSFEHIEAVRGLLNKTTGRVELARGVEAQREKDELRFWVEGAAQDAAYEYDLKVPGETQLPGARTWIRTLIQLASKETGQAPSLPLIQLNGAGLTVRNWRAGDRFYPLHSSGPKKVKELLTTRKITGRERALWPVVAVGERIVWLRGWGVAADAVAAAGAEGVRIEEVVSPD